MTLHHLSGMLDIINTLGFSDESLFRRRQTLVAAAGLDEATIEARVGFLVVDRVAFYGGRFDISIRGVDPEPAVIVGALDDAERFVDLVAWPLDRPGEIATFGGRVSMLGEAEFRKGWQTIFSSAPRAHRTALAWIMAGFYGFVPIDQHRSAWILLEVGGQILAEDDAHGAELDAARQELIGRGAEIMVAA